MNDARREELLQRYLDGQLDGAEQRACEQEMRDDPGLAEEIDRWRILELRLSKRFSPPIGLDTRLRASVKDHHREPGRQDNHRVLLALGGGIAALALISLAVWSWFIVVEKDPGSPIAAAPIDTSEARQIYDTLAIVQPQPVVACSAPGEVSPAFEDRFGVKMNVEVKPEIPIVGPLDSQACGGDWRGVLAFAGYPDRVRVAIVVERAALYRHIVAPADTGLFVYERRIGDLILYEISPLPEPRCLPLFHQP